MPILDFTLIIRDIAMAALTHQQWDDILGYVREHHPNVTRGWFAQLRPTDLVGGVLHILAESNTQTEYLDNRCRPAFTQAAQTTLGKLVTMHFAAAEVDKDKVESADDPLPPFDSDDQLRLNDDYVFDNFVVGPFNRLAHAAALAVCSSPGVTYNPLFVHGDVGLGKSHLLQAICHQTCQDAGRRVVYISCETFTNHFIEAVERGALNRFRYRYRHVDLLVIDDIQFMGARERSQEEFFHTFNTLHQARKQIVISADSSPAEIPSLEDRLISRFNSGLVAALDRPCLETRMAIVRKKAKLRCIEVSEDVVSLIASRVDTNIRDIEGALLKLDAVCQTQGGRIDLMLARQVLGNDAEPRMITIADIVDAVTRHYGVRLADLQGKKRNRSVTFPRQLCMYLGRELTNLSLEEIGGYFGGRDHTTVMHASRIIAARYEEDEHFAAMINNIKESIRRKRSDAA